MDAPVELEFLPRPAPAAARTLDPPTSVRLDIARIAGAAVAVAG